MKKIFIQIGWMISKYKKKLIYGILAFFVTQIGFFGMGGIRINNYVFADNGQTQDQVAEKELKEWKETLSFLNKTIYVLIYPILILAGKLVDNSLVYGEIFGFDAVLWKLWNLVKNLANFTLGFIFLVKIFKYLIDGKEKVKDILLKSLIAGIGIQASWFFMAALIDLSTILTYGVGGLPITMLKDEQIETKYNPYILKNVVIMDANDMGKVDIYLTNNSGAFYISECQTFSYGGTGNKEELILAPKMIYYKDGSNKFNPTDATRCHYGGQVYYFKNLYKGIQNDNAKFPGYSQGGKFSLDCNEDDGCNEKQTIYESLLKVQGNLLETLTGKNEIEDLIKDATILEIGNAHEKGGLFGSIFDDVPVYSENDKFGLDVDNRWTGEGGGTSRLQDILSDNSYVGVFTVLYSSLIGKSRNVISQAKESGFFTDVLNTALSLGFLLAISIPLIAAVIVFLMRIGILWVAISLSPFIVLLAAFDLFKSKWLGNIKFLEYIKLDNLILIIFSPAVVCFAVSLAAVLITIIQNINIDLEKISGKKEILGGLIQVNIASFTMPIAQIMNLMLGVAITWFILRVALETSKLGQSNMISSIKNLATSALGSMPVVPIPSKDGTKMMGVGTVFGRNGSGGIISRLGSDLRAKYDAKDNEALEELINPEKAEQKANDKKWEDGLNNYIEGLTTANIGQDWMNEYHVTVNDTDGTVKTITFNTLKTDGDKKKVIEAINGIKDAAQRGKFSGAEGIEIAVGGEKYRFVKEYSKNGKTETVNKWLTKSEQEELNK